MVWIDRKAGQWLMGMVLGAGSSFLLLLGLQGAVSSAQARIGEETTWHLRCEDLASGLRFEGQFQFPPSGRPSDGGPVVSIFDGNLVLSDPGDPRREIEVERVLSKSASGDWQRAGRGPYLGILRSPAPGSSAELIETPLQCSFL